MFFVHRLEAAKAPVALPQSIFMHTLVYDPETARVRADIHLLAAAKAGILFSRGKIGNFQARH